MMNIDDMHELIANAMRELINEMQSHATDNDAFDAFIISEIAYAIREFAICIDDNADIIDANIIEIIYQMRDHFDLPAINKLANEYELIDFDDSADNAFITHAAKLIIKYDSIINS